MKARHEYEIDPGNAPYQLWTNRYDLAEGRADRNVVLGFAMHFTSVTSDTPFFILIQIVSTHRIPPFLLSTQTFLTCTKHSAIGQLPPTVTSRSPFMKILSLIPLL